MMKKIFSIILFCCSFSIINAQTLQLKTDSLVLAIQEVSSSEGCLVHKNTVKAAAAYYLYTPYSEDDVVRQASQKLVVEWATNTDELNLQLAPHMHEGLLDKEVKQGTLLAAYIAAADLYAITNNVKETTLEAYLYALNETLHFYESNNQFIGESKYWNKLLKKSEADRQKELIRLFKLDNRK